MAISERPDGRDRSRRGHGSTGKWDGLWANAGFGSTCAKGVHDDTWARAVVIEQDDTTVAMVSLDVVGFFNNEIVRARDELARRYPDLPIDELVVSSTHTHEGVDTMGYWGSWHWGSTGSSPPTRRSSVRRSSTPSTTRTRPGSQPGSSSRRPTTPWASGTHARRT